MKTNAQLKLEANHPIQVNADSIYKPIERQERKFNKLKIPKSIEANLPFTSKPKNSTARKTPGKSYVTKRAVVMEKDEKVRHAFMQALGTLRNDKVKKRKESNLVRKEKKMKEVAKNDDNFKDVRQALAKKRHRSDGKEVAARERKKSRGRD